MNSMITIRVDHERTLIVSLLLNGAYSLNSAAHFSNRNDTFVYKKFQ